MMMEILMLLTFLVISQIIYFIRILIKGRRISKIFKIISIPGIIIHELSHLLMCLLTRTPIKSFQILNTTKGDDEPPENTPEINGTLKIKDKKKLTFILALSIGLAPAFVSYWTVSYLWFLINEYALVMFLYPLILITMGSIVLYVSPSKGDLKAASIAFKQDIHYSLLQILFLTCSLITVMILGILFELPFISYFHNFSVLLYYIVSVFLLYSPWKYFILFLIYIKNKLGLRDINAERETKERGRTRKRYRPAKPTELGYKEVQW
jgi:hypothetical protein